MMCNKSQVFSFTDDTKAKRRRDKDFVRVTASYKNTTFCPNCTHAAHILMTNIPLYLPPSTSGTFLFLSLLNTFLTTAAPGMKRRKTVVASQKQSSLDVHVHEKINDTSVSWF